MITVVRAFCRACNGDRNCIVRAHHDERGGDEHYQHHTKWLTMECQGCEYTFIKKISTNSENYVDYYEEDGTTETHYVETSEYWPALSTRERPEWMMENGIDANDVDTLDRVLIELYKSLDAGLFILSAIGVRTAFDVASVVLNIDANLSFSAKLDALEANHHIQPSERMRLATLIEGGNASAHRGWKPTPIEMDTLMDILEHFVANAFVLPQRRKSVDAKAEKLKAAIPARKAEGGRLFPPHDKK